MPSLLVLTNRLPLSLPTTLISTDAAPTLAPQNDVIPDPGIRTSITNDDALELEIRDIKTTQVYHGQSCEIHQ